ncbi:hypothetical protein DIPPA_00636 [Diplonema papillatum]|nr:hypothetical protein DIPPA_00636 [Diplonema papillatum]KAJ9470622.1 hypothetical protein DIPPA_00636 [Diplonema papillatum]KAJ9470623.1 hypothetical protein DIPPA_00636 [Diplonema papillatum]KAJ9470624.1 hypothetical protein DIPPA_00636 [Diplonema papillatum]
MAQGVRFVPRSVFWYILIIGGMGATAVAAHSPDSFPSFLSFISKSAEKYPALWPTVFYSALAVHMLEAGYVAFKAAASGCTVRDTTLWGLQTLVLGAPSTFLFLKALAKAKKV